MNSYECWICGVQRTSDVKQGAFITGFPMDKGVPGHDEMYWM